MTARGLGRRAPIVTCTNTRHALLLTTNSSVAHTQTQLALCIEVFFRIHPLQYHNNVRCRRPCTGYRRLRDSCGQKLTGIISTFWQVGTTNKCLGKNPSTHTRDIVQTTRRTDDTKTMLLILHNGGVGTTKRKVKLEKTAQGKCWPVRSIGRVRPTRLVVDAALRRIGKSRHGGHKIVNISRNCERI